jgi:asparagine synthase (glutamine-hydrolysing)
MPDGAALRETVRRMATRLVHRGPDDSGEWVDGECGVALAHRRLSIIDLSAEGHQPMASAGGRFVLVFNGEIYNYRELRAELDAARGGISWRGHSDTEVMLAAFEHWGVENALPRFNGMFALAVWDREFRRLYLARDRFGEKPLYYAVVGGVLLFGSELKALAAHPAFRGEIDRGALQLYMRFNYVPAPHTIYTCARKLPASAFLAVLVDPVSGGFRAGEPRYYWSATHAALAARDRRLVHRGEAKEELLALFGRAVRARMMSDVPLGAFLSGGIDSSLVVAMMRGQESATVRTFTIGYDEPGYDESAHAESVARHLGTVHSCQRITAEDARAAIVRMPELYDEPFADSSQIPTYLVARAAREQVTVALTGDGGDELFGGYDRYFVGQRVFPLLERVPHYARRPIAGLVNTLDPAAWDRVIGSLRRMIGGERFADFNGARLHRLAQQLRVRAPHELYEIMMARPEDGSVPLAGAAALLPLHGGESGWAQGAAVADAMMLFDTLNILPDDFLVKVDRASMGVSLETRAPFLDPELFEFAWRIPLEWKFDARAGKLLLREALQGFVPTEIIERPKQGFSIPVGKWLHGPLRDWAESLLDERRLRADGFLDPLKIRRKWAEHLAGTHDRQNELWSALVFQGWLDVARGGAAPGRCEIAA